MLPYDDIVINHQGPKGIAVQDNRDFFAITSALQMNVKKSDSAISGDTTDECQLFECPEPGCQQIIKSFRELEIRIEIEDHGKKPMNESIYDRLRREWAARFSTVDEDSQGASNNSRESARGSEQAARPSNLTRGWALSKPRAPTRFSENVKDYLKAKFNQGEQTGLKANPKQVSADMRNARDEQNKRCFSREEWLTVVQIKNFFSRLASSKRRGKMLLMTKQKLKKYWKRKKKATDKKW